MLQDVTAGQREKFSIRGCQPKRAASRRSKANTTATATKVSKVVKAKRAKSTTKAQDKRQHINSIAPSFSSSAAAQADDDADVMDYAPTEAVVDDYAQETRFEYVHFDLLIISNKTSPLTD